MSADNSSRNTWDGFIGGLVALLGREFLSFLVERKRRTPPVMMDVTVYLSRSVASACDAAWQTSVSHELSVAHTYLGHECFFRGARLDRRSIHSFIGNTTHRDYHLPIHSFRFSSPRFKTCLLVVPLLSALWPVAPWPRARFRYVAASSFRLYRTGHTHTHDDRPPQ